MQNLKIRVNSADESREAQELFFELGGSWAGYKKIHDWPEIKQLYLDENYITFSNDINFFVNDPSKEITLPELRDLVVLKRNDKKDRNVIDPEYGDANLYLDSKSDLFVFHLPTQTWKESDLNNDPEVLARLQPIKKNMKEYLDKKPDGSYELIFSNGGCIDRDWIEIPELSQFAVLNGDDEVAFYDGNGLEKSHFISSAIIWQRDQDEPFLTPETTLNDQYAEIEEVRQAEIHGTVKAKPDFNFGAAEASGGVDATLAERQTQYGCYEDVAQTTQQILSALRIGNYDKLPAPMKESLHMIASKMARIVNGDPEYFDNWHDIGGYAKLIEKLIKGE